MKLVLEEPIVLKDCITAVAEVIKEGNLKITKDQISLTSMDEANVMMVKLVMDKPFFKEYDTKEEEQIIGINILDFKKALLRVNAGDTLVMDDEEEGFFKSTIQGKSVKKFKIGILELEGMEKSPNTKYNTSFMFDAEQLDEYIQDIDSFADTLSIMLKDKKLFFSGSGDINDAEIDIKDNVQIEGEGADALARYSLEYMKSIIKGKKIFGETKKAKGKKDKEETVETVKGNKVKVQFNTDYPLCVEFNNKHIHLWYVLAPRVDNN